MANEKNLKPFKKGNPGGPGRPVDPPELKTIKQMNQGEFKTLIYSLINLKPEELSTFKGTVLEMAMASAMQQAIKKGDFSLIQYFMDRVFGKVTEKVELNASHIIIDNEQGRSQLDEYKRKINACKAIL